MIPTARIFLTLLLSEAIIFAIGLVVLARWG